VAPLEVRAAAAAWDSDGRLTLWLPNQGAQAAKRALADMLGLEDEGLRVITPDVGGAFGAKFGADAEHAVVALAARRAGRPVRWVETRSENMLAMPHGRAQVQTVTIGGDRNGRIGAYRLRILQDSGAYPKFGALLPSLTALMAPGVYDIPALETSFLSVVTNTTPVGAYRGAGRPEATAALERAIDLFAAELGIDPADVRRRNLLPRFTEPYTSKGGAVYDSGDYPALYRQMLELLEYDRWRAEQAGRGEAERRQRADHARLSGSERDARSHPRQQRRQAGDRGPQRQGEQEERAEHVQGLPPRSRAVRCRSGTIDRDGCADRGIVHRGIVASRAGQIG
jgi:carbon-monoxide dehydrogenase large subunit